MEIIESTYQRIWKTRGARFISHSNYLSQNKCSVFTVGILSTYIIILSYTFLSPTLSKYFISGDLNLVILAASLITLVFSIIESSKDYKLKADKLHRNAMELSELYDEMQVVFFSTEDINVRILKTEQILKKYNAIIQKCDENHNSYDFDMFLLHNSKELGLKRNCAMSLLLKIYYYLRVRIYFYLWIILPVVIFLILTIR